MSQGSRLGRILTPEPIFNLVFKFSGFIKNQEIGLWSPAPDLTPESRILIKSENARTESVVFLSGISLPLS